MNEQKGLFLTLSFGKSDGCRIDAEASDLKSKLEGMNSSEKLSSEGQGKISDGTTNANIKVGLIIVITLCSRFFFFFSYRKHCFYSSGLVYVYDLY